MQIYPCQFHLVYSFLKNRLAGYLITALLQPDHSVNEAPMHRPSSLDQRNMPRQSYRYVEQNMVKHSLSTNT